jgi:riboflavin kinase/FMN adenylyltransferase
MRLLNWNDSFRMPEKKTALSIGVFDGLHRGHQAQIRKITGKSPDLTPAVVTFRENPKKALNPETFEGDIISFDDKMTLFKDLGVEICMIIDFTRDFSIMGGRLFFEELCVRLNPGYVAIGRNFHCGYGRDTDAEAFAALAAERGFTVEIIGPVLEGGVPVSSSRIRALVRSGEFEEAGRLLDRPFRIHAD